MRHREARAALPELPRRIAASADPPGGRTSAVPGEPGTRLQGSGLRGLIHRAPPNHLRSAIAALLIFIGASAFAATPSVKIESGFVQGVRDDNVISYKGIPFAAPPVHELRWKAPQSPKHWKGIIKADRFPSQCSQLGPPLPTMPEAGTMPDLPAHLLMDAYMNSERPN